MNSNSTTSIPPIRLRRMAEIVVVILIAGLLVGFVPRWIRRHKLLAETETTYIPTVEVTLPTTSKPDLGMPLPAEVQAFVQASIHARASGYLKDWFVDIGDHVTNGQVLAEIDTPELDQQLAQAIAELDLAAASLDLARTTAARWEELLKTASVSEQETAEKAADYTLKKANVEAARANMQRLENLKRFGHVTAPFDGTITLRNTDIGQLISANSGPELFRLAQTDPLRVYVRVPQQFTHAIVPGQKAELTFQELQGRKFEATVMRTAGAVDPDSRTLLVALQVPNPSGEILAGSYAQVRFNEAVDSHVLTVSDNVLIFRAQGMQVAVVDSNNMVQLHSITLGRDFGNIIQVLSGLEPDARIIINPPDSIADGMVVEISNASETNSAK